MSYFWIALRGLAFWLGAFYAFTLVWGPLELSILPVALSGPIMLAPVGALVFGAVMPDKSLIGTPRGKVLLCAVLSIGIVGCLITAIDDLASQPPNMYGFWFRVACVVMMAALYFRALPVRKIA